MYSSQYYAEKRAKLHQKIQRNLQKLSNIAYEFVLENDDIKERMKELEIQEAESRRMDEEAKKKEADKKQEPEIKPVSEFNKEAEAKVEGKSQNQKNKK